MAASVRGATGLLGINAEYIAGATDSSIVYDSSDYDETNHSSQVGMAATPVTGASAGAAEFGLGGAAESYLMGIIDRVEADSTCSIQYKGGMSCAYDTGHAPAVGGQLTANGSGAVRAPGAVTGRGVVLSLDTTNHIAYFILF